MSQRSAFRIHRLLSYVAFAQMLAWICGGVVFSLLPFDSVVKGGAIIEKPVVVLPAGWSDALATGLPDVGTVTKVESFAGPLGAAIRVRGTAAETPAPHTEAPSEPLPGSPALFWDARPAHGAGQGATHVPVVHAALIKRLGALS